MIKNDTLINFNSNKSNTMKRKKEKLSMFKAAVNYLDDERRIQNLIAIILGLSWLQKPAFRAAMSLKNRLVQRANIEKERSLNENQPPLVLTTNLNDAQVNSDDYSSHSKTFNRMNPYFRAYFNIILFWCSYATLRILLPIDYLFSLLGSFELPGHCYFAGRFVFEPALSEVFALNVAVIIVLWECWQSFRNEKYPPSLYLFLYQDELEIRRTQEELINGQLARQNSYNLSKNKNLILNYLMAYLRLQDQTIDKQANSKIPALQLRPNRTLKAYYKLRRRLALATVTMMIPFLTSVTIITPAVLVQIVRDLSYLRFYPQCSPELDQLASRGKLTYFTMHLTNHKIYAFVMDFIENLLFWLMAGFAAMLTIPSPCLLNFDLMIYWTHTEQKISELLVKIRLHAGNHMTNRTLSASLPRSIQGYRRRAKLNSKLDVDIRKVQDEIVDFFRQFDIADIWVSDILFAALLIWMSCVASFRYAIIISGEQDISPIVQIAQLLGFIIYTMMSISLWQIHSRLGKSYVEVCSILAQCPTEEHKIRFLAICDNFLRRTGFTIAGGYPFNSRTYLSLLGWTFSCLFIVDSLFRSHSPNNLFLHDTRVALKSQQIVSVQQIN